VTDLDYMEKVPHYSTGFSWAEAAAYCRAEFGGELAAFTNREDFYNLHVRAVPSPHFTAAAWSAGGEADGPQGCTPKLTPRAPLRAHPSGAEQVLHQSGRHRVRVQMNVDGAHWGWCPTSAR